MARTLNDVKAQILTCLNCDLSDHCRQPIPVRTVNSNPDYLVVGEAPGQVEDRRGEPFVGPAGAFLKRELRRAGLFPSDGAFLNAVSCFPKERKTPTAEEVNACRQNLYDQLDVLETRPTLVCGSVALKALLPHADITYASGIGLNAHGKLLYPVYHPAYVLRSRLVLESWQRQIREFATMVETGAPLVSHRCLYCNGYRVGIHPTCPRHLKWWQQDNFRIVTKPKVVPHPTLF